MRPTQGDGKLGVQLDDVDTGTLAGAGVGLAALLSPLGLGLAVHLNGERERLSDGREYRFGD